MTKTCGWIVVGVLLTTWIVGASAAAAATVSWQATSKPRASRPLEWPQWGGPHRDFKSDATGLATAWPAEGPPRL